MSLAHLLARQARLRPRLHAQGSAVFHGTQPWANQALWAQRWRSGCKRKGWPPGERVLIFMHNHPRHLELLWAARWAGLVVVPVNAKLHLAEVEWIIDNAQAAWATALMSTLGLPATPWCVPRPCRTAAACTPFPTRWPARATWCRCRVAWTRLSCLRWVAAWGA